MHCCDVINIHCCDVNIHCLLIFSLRRRASSLDFLPEFANKNCTQNGCANNKASPFARTASMSQRSPFRKKIAFADLETSVAATKELRPKNLKRSKSGIDSNCFFMF